MPRPTTHVWMNTVQDLGLDLGCPPTLSSGAHLSLWPPLPDRHIHVCSWPGAPRLACTTGMLWGDHRGACRPGWASLCSLPPSRPPLPARHQWWAIPPPKPSPGREPPNPQMCSLETMLLSGGAFGPRGLGAQSWEHLKGQGARQLGDCPASGGWALAWAPLVVLLWAYLVHLPHLGWDNAHTQLLPKGPGGCRCKQPTLSFLRALNFFRHSTVSCLCIMEATVERCCGERGHHTLQGP